jgi:hypothetical protein
VIDEMDNAEDHSILVGNETMHWFCRVVKALPSHVRDLWCLGGLIEGEIAQPQRLPGSTLVGTEGADSKAHDGVLG